MQGEFEIQKRQWRLSEIVSEIARLIQTFQDNYFEQDPLKHAMIGYLDYVSMTVRNLRWTRAKYLVLIDSLIE